ATRWTSLHRGADTSIIISGRPTRKMSRPTSTRREIAPLHVPWLQHEQFPATKQACSSRDGLVVGSKNSLIKVVQELKRGRANMDKQLAQLDTQLLAITNYLDGKSSNMLPPHLIMYVEETSDVMAPLAGDGRRHGVAGNGAAVAGKFSGISKSESEPPTPALVEEDINLDTPCTTTGLWKYLYAYSFFKTITPDDMEQALLLEDPNAFSDDLESSEGRREVLAGLDFDRLQDITSLNKSDPQDLDDFFKERLVASLCSVDLPPSLKEGEEASCCQPDDEDKHSNGTSKKEASMEMDSLLHPDDIKSWKPKGLTRVLRDIGLVEGDDKEVAQISLSSTKDDEVSQEIRSLQRQLRVCIEQTNESKRKFRKIMDETKPWLSQQKEDDDATIKKYFTMWQTKKELARKKKLRDKKLQRRQALRLGGGGSGKPLAHDIDVKQR
ncbi:Histone acetyltransferases subunit 3, partial [Phytophthora infestans]